MGQHHRCGVRVGMPPGVSDSDGGALLAVRRWFPGSLASHLCGGPPAVTGLWGPATAWF